MSKKIIAALAASAAVGGGLSVLPLIAAPAAFACANVVNGSGGALGNGGGVSESCLPNGDKYHCESVYVLGFGGQNCFVLPVGDPRNPW